MAELRSSGPSASALVLATLLRLGLLYFFVSNMRVSPRYSSNLRASFDRVLWEPTFRISPSSPATQSCCCCFHLRLTGHSWHGRGLLFLHMCFSWHEDHTVSLLCCHCQLSPVSKIYCVSVFDRSQGQFAVTCAMLPGLLSLTSGLRSHWMWVMVHFNEDLTKMFGHDC
ncbi:hypothetical protein IW261DRAFT_907906 [Armillaria novae-zelandiae]|uniref:Uncharacterized protein n=1 Tax=Armillaria novae-zelandiae TaxID=153914 RepID=A0AA39NSN5_9AGAR|nr:hypothetical protein IW261DRAFT_907906 [Armillaria novae-zelandiae]